MPSREIDPRIIHLTERYPEDVISVAGSLAGHYSVGQMTDILARDELVDYHAQIVAQERTYFTALRKEGGETERQRLKDAHLREELARAAFGYLAEVRQLWHRDPRSDLLVSA